MRCELAERKLYDNMTNVGVDGGTKPVGTRLEQRSEHIAHLHTQKWHKNKNRLAGLTKAGDASEDGGARRRAFSSCSRLQSRGGERARADGIARTATQTTI